MHTDYVLTVGGGADPSQKDIMSAAARSSLTPAAIETPDADAVLTLAHGVNADANLVLVKLRAFERRLVHGSDSFHLNARAAGSSEFHSLSLLPVWSLWSMLVSCSRVQAAVGLWV